MVKNTKKHSAGFTLIELLVVISIIALLSSVVLTSLSTTRNKAQANKLTQEVVQLRNALELYKSDNGAYPQVGGSYFYGYAGYPPYLGDYSSIGNYLKLPSMLIGQAGIFTYLPPSSNHFYGTGYLNHTCGGVQPPQGSYMLMFTAPSEPINLGHTGWDGYTDSSYCILAP